MRALISPIHVLCLAAVLFFKTGHAMGGGMAVQACFSPIRKCSSLITREIALAQKEILVALYAFTSDELALALIKAHQRGVKVQLLLDKEFDRENEGSRGSFLEKHGLPVRRASGVNTGNPERASGLMHQKFAVIDRKTVLTGSYNWTVSADHFNDENLLLFRDAAPLAEEYRTEFFRIWERKP